MSDVEVDARRYRWLRENFTRLVVNTYRTVERTSFVGSIRVNHNLIPPEPASVDAAIDAAITEQESAP